VGTACVCEGGGLRATLHEDFDRYIFDTQAATGQSDAKAGMGLRLTGMLQHGWWAVLAYRLNHYAKYKLNSRLLTVIFGVFHQIVFAVTSIEISSGAHIGPGLWLPHGGHVIIGAVRAGSNCNVFQGVTVGDGESTAVAPEPGSWLQLPTLGNRVWIGPGAVVVGRVTVGDDASVSANSLVTRDVPPRGVMLGVPARLISRNGSFTQIRYRGMDEDKERSAALAADLETVSDRTR
jgi:serine O-acetyltransferase